MTDQVKNEKLSRRNFVAGAAAAVAAIPLTAASSRARAQEMPMLQDDDPTAVALKYVSNAADADQALRGSDDRFCRNCALFAGADGAEAAPCSIFPGKQVAAGGWCSVWAPKPGS